MKKYKFKDPFYFSVRAITRHTTCLAHLKKTCTCTYSLNLTLHHHDPQHGWPASSTNCTVLI